MLKLSDSRNFGRTLSGIGLIAGPFLFLVATLVSPAWADDTAEYLREVASDEGAHVASSMIFLVGALLVVAGLFGVIRLFRERRVNVGQISAGLIMVGVIASLSFYAVTVFEVEMIDPRADFEQMVALSERTEESAGAILIIVLFLVGIVGGSLGLTFALFRRRIVPVWVPAILLLSTLLEFFAESQAVAAIAFALLTVALGALGFRILYMSDEEWDHWELPSRGSETSPQTPAPG